MAEASELVRQRHANRCGSRTEVKRALCELWWMELTTCGVSASPEAVILKMHAKEMIRLPDDGPEIRIRCGGQIRQLYAINQNDVPYRRWPKNLHEWR